MRKLPDTLALVFFVLILFTVLTWLIPAGTYERELVQGREVLVPGSYQSSDRSPQGIGPLLLAPIKGFMGASQIIAFVFLVGGAFGVINRTGAIYAALQDVVKKSSQNPKYKKAVIPLLMLIFSVAGATFGMSEEVLVFILITLPLSTALGYDTVTGIAIPFIGAGAGFAGAIANPFTIGIAQGIAEIPPFSGWEYRILVWFLFTSLAIYYVNRHASRLLEGKSKAVNGDSIGDPTRESDHLPKTSFDGSKKLVLVVFAIGIVGLIVGVTLWDWYINEIAALFIAIALLSAILGRLSVNDASQSFAHGASEMMGAALVIALSKAILVVAEDGQIIDTVLYALAGLADGLPAVASVQVMFLVQSALNTILPSGSGQAALTMPIMAPLSDLLEISRQTAVLAFQLGDGITNLIIPTSGITMGVLQIAKLPYTKWVKWAGPLILLFMLLAMLVLIPPVLFFYYQ
ncbi:MAG: YfcC family protein [Cyclobacteriaceae bacterium]|nr:YfcC family protein [Cyclobacteriaceae bacterium]